MKSDYLKVGMGMALVSAILVVGCTSTGNTQSTTVVESSVKEQGTDAIAETTTVVETTIAAVDKVELNYDIANIIGEEYDVVVEALGTPDDEISNETSTIISYNTPLRQFVLTLDTDTQMTLLSSAYATAQDLWNVAETIDIDAFIEALDATDVSDIEFIPNSMFEESVSAKSFVAEGYMFSIGVDTQGYILPTTQCLISVME